LSSDAVSKVAEDEDEGEEEYGNLDCKGRHRQLNEEMKEKGQDGQRNATRHPKRSLM
jgi:hypothetical protein